MEEKNTVWNTPYKFNGKELNEETGLSYYSARYYNPRESIFLSVDPLAEKTMTPYQYTYQNPVNYTDPTGMSAECVDCKKNVKNPENGQTYTSEGGNILMVMEIGRGMKGCSIRLLLKGECQIIREQ